MIFNSILNIRKFYCYSYCNKVNACYLICAAIHLLKFCSAIELEANFFLSIFKETAPMFLPFIISDELTVFCCCTSFLFYLQHVIFLQATFKIFSLTLILNNFICFSTVFFLFLWFIEFFKSVGLQSSSNLKFFSHYSFFPPISSLQLLMVTQVTYTCIRLLKVAP